MSDHNKHNDETSYYRYGPFDPGKEEEANTLQDSEVEMTEPEPVKPLPSDYAPVAYNAWAPPEKRKRGGWKSALASFLAGALIVSGLMFAADKTNLFTGGEAAAVSDGGQQAVQTSAGAGSANVRNASIDIVRPNTIAEIVANSRAAVIKIETYAKSSSRSRSNSFFDDPFFRYFFDDGRSRQRQSSDTLQKVGEGSGFIFDSEGYILTNQHVIDGADEIKVYLEGYEEPFTAERLGESVDQDLAALKIKADKPLPFLKLGDVNQLNVGDWVIAIGNPYGYDHTVTVGVLSAKERPITIPDGNVTRRYEHLLQTDASINPGNSGGPLLNLNGEVIGINTAINAQAQGIGFAIPTSTVSGVLDNLKNNTPIPKPEAPYVGVVLTQLDETSAEKLGFKGTDGALITQVEIGGPAHKAGVQAWDIVTEVAGTKVKTYEDVGKLVQKQKVGDKITMKIFRDGKTYEVAIIVGDRNNS